MTDSRTPTWRRPTEGRWLAWLGQPIRYLALGEDTCGQYALSWGTVPVGEGPPPHSHDFEEGFYIISGEVTFTAGDRTVVLTAGGFINIGAGTAHYLKNTGREEAQLLVIVGPAGFDQFQFEGGTPIDGPEAAVENLPPTDFEFLQQIGPKYKVDMNPPLEAFQVAPNITVRNAGEGLQVAAVGDRYRFLATHDETNGKYALWEATVYPGGGPPPHVHHREDEGFLILSGEMSFQIGGERYLATAGSFANMPVGLEHTFKNETNVPAHMLILVAPGGLEKMFAQSGRILNGPDDPVAPPSHEEIERLLNIAPQFGIEIRIPHHDRDS